MFSLKEENKIIKILLACSCFVLFFITLFTVFYYGNSTLLGDFYKPNNDDVKFIRSAWTLYEKGIYIYHKPPTPTVFMMPGLPFTLAFLMSIFGKFGGITALRIIQAVLQNLSLLLIFYIGRKVFNSKVAIVAVILDVFYIAEYWVPNLVLTETFFKFFVMCLIYFSIYAIESGKTRFYVLGGLSWGLAALFRPTIATYPIIILIMWIIRKVKFIDAVKYTLIVSVTFCIVLSPWWIRNYKTFNRFIPFTLATGNPMLQGTFINYDQSTKATDGLDYKQFNYGDPKNTEIESNAIEVAISKYRIKNLFPKQPIKFILWYTFGKGWIQINYPFYWEKILGIGFVPALLYHFILLIFGLLGFILFFRKKSENKLALLPMLTTVYFVLVYLPFYTMGRYFFPAMPFVMIFSGYFIIYLSEKYGIKYKILNKLKR